MASMTITFDDLRRRAIAEFSDDAVEGSRTVEIGGERYRRLADLIDEFYFDITPGQARERKER